MVIGSTDLVLLFDGDLLRAVIAGLIVHAIVILIALGVRFATSEEARLIGLRATRRYMWTTSSISFVLVLPYLSLIVDLIRLLASPPRGRD